jgi:D-alanyl-D-alanine carboxypeptidase
MLKMWRSLAACAGLLTLVSLQSVFAQPATPDSFIAAYAKEHDFNGSILIQKEGKVRFARSFGLANIPFKVPNTNQTKYKIASITKAFTSVLILQLQEQGRVDLDKPIGAYLPEYAGEGADKVTLHHLLNHTSGLANFDTVTDVETAIKSGIPVYQTPYTSICLPWWRVCS